MKLIRYRGELSVSGTNVLMKLCLEKQRKIERVIERTEDRRVLKLLSRAWWGEFFKIEELEGVSELDLSLRNSAETLAVGAGHQPKGSRQNSGRAANLHIEDRELAMRSGD